MRSGRAMLTTVTLREIEAVFEVLEELGISREAVVIPLTPATPGRVALRADGRIDIVLDGSLERDADLARIRDALAAILASPDGARVQRDD